MSDFATLADVISITGKAYTPAEQERITTLLPLVSDALRFEAEKVGKDMDDMVTSDTAYASVVKLVTVDIVCRAMRQSMDGEPMTQESQAAIGYSWSGTYAIPGGGVASSIMRNDLKRLGLRRQQYGFMDLYSQEV